MYVCIHTQPPPNPQQSTLPQRQHPHPTTGELPPLLPPLASAIAATDTTTNGQQQQQQQQRGRLLFVPEEVLARCDMETDALAAFLQVGVVGRCGEVRGGRFRYMRGVDAAAWMGRMGGGVGWGGGGG
jgi:hypothetical protein